MGALLETKSKNFQILYDTLYCLWLLSYSKQVAEFIGSTKIIQSLANILKKGVTKEKVIRMTLATLGVRTSGVDLTFDAKNLLGVSRNNEQMLDSGIMKPLDSLSRKSWADEDVVSDIALLTQALQKNLAELR